MRMNHHTNNAHIQTTCEKASNFKLQIQIRAQVYLQFSDSVSKIRVYPRGPRQNRTGTQLKMSKKIYQWFCYGNHWFPGRELRMVGSNGSGGGSCVWLGVTVV